MSSARSVLYCGDPHGNFAHIVREAYAGTHDAIVVLGDLNLARPLHVPEDVNALAHIRAVATTLRKASDGPAAGPQQPPSLFGPAAEIDLHREGWPAPPSHHPTPPASAKHA